MSWRSKTFEGPLPALAVRGPELRRSLGIATSVYLFAMVHLACVGGSQTNTFCQMLGFKDFDFGLYTALPFLATFAQMLATIPIERTGFRKYQFIECQIVSRLLWLAAAAIGLFMPLPSRAAVYLMLLVLLLISVLNSFAGLAWWTWMADLIPRRLRGRYMADRETWSQVVSLGAIVVVGIFTDFIAGLGKPTSTSAPASAAAAPLLRYALCGLFVVGALMGLPVLRFRRIREILAPRKDPPRPRSQYPDTGSPQGQPWPQTPESNSTLRKMLSSVLVDPLRDRTFRRFAMFICLLMFGANVSAPFLFLNSLNNLGFSNLGTNFIFMVCGAAGGIFSLKRFGRLIDRFGRKPVLWVSTAGAVLTILPWAFIMPQTPDFGLKLALNWLAGHAGSLFGHGDFSLVPAGTPVGAFVAGAMAATIGGIAWAGIGQAQTNYMLSFSDLAGQSRYIAAFSIFSSVGGLAGGLAGGALTQGLEFLRQHPFVLGPFVWDNWRISFLASAFLRSLALLMLFWLPDPGGSSSRLMLRHVAAGVYRRTLARLPGMA